MTAETSNADKAVRISGELDAQTVPRRLRESSGWFQRGATTTIDLADVPRADSAGVALLLEWVRQARVAGGELVFTHAPEQMRAIIDFCALNDIIPLDGAAPAATAGDDANA